MLYTAGSRDSIILAMNNFDQKKEEQDLILQLQEPIDYSTVYLMDFNPEGKSPEDLIEKTLTACFLAAFALESGFEKKVCYWEIFITSKM